jgi:hypothetical protein
MESALKQRGLDLSNATLDRMESEWQTAKG